MCRKCLNQTKKKWNEKSISNYRSHWEQLMRAVRLDVSHNKKKLKKKSDKNIISRRRLFHLLS